MEGNRDERYEGLARIARIYLQSALSATKSDRGRLEAALRSGSAEELDAAIPNDKLGAACREVYSERKLADAIDWNGTKDLALYRVLREKGVIDALKGKLGRKSDSKIPAGTGYRSGNPQSASPAPVIPLNGNGSKSGSGRTYAPGELERKKVIFAAVKKQDEGRPKQRLEGFSPLQKKIFAGILGATGIIALTYGFKYAFSGHEPTREEVRASIYRGVDETNFVSEKNRERHVKNLDGLLFQLKEMQDTKDSSGEMQTERAIREYMQTVKEKDAQFYPALEQKVKELESKHKVRS